MTMKSKVLSDFRYTYCGPWPRSLSYLFLIACGSPFAAGLLTGEPLAIESFVKSSAVALLAFFVGFWAKAKKHG